ncbi:hypothetical protein GLW03_12915 [Halobacillus halophilus]|uniref:hypothetical protein n=1 Tax=Halobacillus halophilus TaxID=1570 RepID=UPI00137115A8|nr:hypothetical protein [Halobacillus halophilus]MYL30727.1 hypothetical protein [Halobacillus halophilus]
MMDIIITVLTSGATTTAVIALYRHFLSRNIESYKNELLYDLQRKVHDFQLYSNKKHEIYAEIYKQLYLCNNEIKLVTAIYKQFEYYINYTQKELEDFLNERKVLQIEKDEIKRLFSTDKGKMAEKIHDIIGRDKFLEVEKLRIKTYQFTCETLIYQSEEVDSLCDKITDNQAEILKVFNKYKVSPNKKQTLDCVETLNVELDGLIKDLQRAMQNELSIGYYGNESKRGT